MRLLREIAADARELARAATGEVTRRSVLRTVLENDSFAILVLWRLRVAARRWRIPLANHALRCVQTIVYGIELGKEITLGQGVYFVHPIGIVVGGDSRVGDRVRFLGSNTVGQAQDDGGYPVIGAEAVVGCGARILGSIQIGEHATIGANAVVLDDVPAGAVAVGIPARVKMRSLEGARRA